MLGSVSQPQGGGEALLTGLRLFKVGRNGNPLPLFKRNKRVLKILKEIKILKAYSRILEIE